MRWIVVALEPKKQECDQENQAKLSSWNQIGPDFFGGKMAKSVRKFALFLVLAGVGSAMTATQAWADDQVFATRDSSIQNCATVLKNVAPPPQSDPSWVWYALHNACDDSVMLTFVNDRGVRQSVVVPGRDGMTAEQKALIPFEGTVWGHPGPSSDFRLCKDTSDPADRAFCFPN